VVIAVNVGSPLLKPEEVTGLVSVVGQMVNLLTEQNVSRSLALLGPKDVYLRPELGDITAGSFDRQLEAAEIGKATALAAVDSLKRYSVSPEDYAAWRAKVSLPTSAPAPTIQAIEIGKTRYVNSETLRSAIAQKEGEPLDVPRLDKDLIGIYSTGDLQTIDYSVVTEREKTILRVTPIEKPLGPDYVRFGLNLYSDSRGDATYNLRALFRRTWLNSLGAEFLTGVQIGSEQRLFAEYYQPLDARHIGFVRAFASGVDGRTSLYVGENRLAEYRVRVGEAGLDVGANLGAYGQARLGWVERKTRASVETGPSLLPDVDERMGGVRAGLAIDTYDFAFFPTKGYKADAEIFDAQHVPDGREKYGRAQLSVGGAWTIGDFILVGNAERSKSTHGVLPPTDLFTLGGPRRLAAFAPGQIRGDDLTYAGADVQYKLTKPIPLLGFAMIAGLQAEAGRMADPVVGTTLTGWQQSFGAYLAANSVFGPIYLGYSDGRNGRGRFYFFIGTP
jgi:NTE family protein